MNQQIIAFIGGGNMAKAMVGGLCKNGFTADHILVIEPNETNRQSLASEFGVQVFDKANPVLLNILIILIKHLMVFAYRHKWMKTIMYK